MLGRTDLLALSERELRAHRGSKIGFVFQDPMSSLNPVMSVGEQIAEPIRTHLGLSQKATQQRVIELLEQVAIPDPVRRASEYPFQLSGGLRQRIMIAIALSCDPQVIIADEPTTALDVTVQAQILDLLRSLVAISGCGVLLITHDIGVVAQVCDKVSVMYAGQVVERGDVDEVLRQPQMPYTRALLQAMPEMRRLLPGERLEAIDGSAVRPGSWAQGCRFAERCTHRREVCTEAPVPLTARSEVQAARCFGTEEDGWIK